jgi:hypothetical protein
MKTDRYSIYDLRGKHVIVSIPPRFGGGKIDAVVEHVSRDVIAKTIDMTFSKIKTKYVFREPSEILKNSDTVSFIYKEMVDDKDDFGEVIGESEHVVEVIVFDVRDN